jgi:hypothetical protein
MVVTSALAARWSQVTLGKLLIVESETRGIDVFCRRMRTSLG